MEKMVNKNGKKSHANISSVGGFSSNSITEREPNDFYMTDPRAINILKRFVDISYNVWENANGLSHLSDRLELLGHKVKRTDLIVRDDKTEQMDFLLYDEMFDGVFDGDIVTNPPFKFINEFIELSHKACTGKVVMFGALNMTSTQNKFYKIFKKYNLSQIITFSHRLTCSRDGVFDKGNAMQFAWFVFDRDKNKDNKINFILVGDHKKDKDYDYDYVGNSSND